VISEVGVAREPRIPSAVIPAQAGIHFDFVLLQGLQAKSKIKKVQDQDGSSFRWDDEHGG
jgi:hypothetical protein